MNWKNYISSGKMILLNDRFVGFIFDVINDVMYFISKHDGKLHRVSIECVTDIKEYVPEKEKMFKWKIVSG